VGIAFVDPVACSARKALRCDIRLEPARFGVDSSDDTGSDLDLLVKRVVSPENQQTLQSRSSGTTAADEVVQIMAPPAGTDVIQTQQYSSRIRSRGWRRQPSSAQAGTAR
jgi:hypothetical protein